MRTPANFHHHDDYVGEGTINLTPLIDVVFVVLIMFILVVPLVEIDRISLSPAAVKKGADMPQFQGESSIRIFVHSDNTIYLNGAPISLEDLPSFLQDAHQQFPNTHPQLYHDGSAYFSTYQSVKNAVESAGFASLDVILKSS